MSYDVYLNNSVSITNSGFNISIIDLCFCYL